MATQIKNLASAENGAFLLSFTWDDVAMSILTVDVVNNGVKDYVIGATRNNNGQHYEFTILSGTEIHQAVPQGAATKLGIEIGPNGKLGGILWDVASQLV